MTKRAEGKKYRDIRAGLVCAEAFQRLAELFIERIGEDVKAGAHEDPPRELGDLVGSATNLAFALELYLKTLLTQLDLTVPQDHDLRNQYDALPLEVRAQIEERYEKAWPRWYGKRASITIAKGPRDEPNWNDYRNMSKELGELLGRSRDLFQSWRYIYEVTVPNDSSYQFHEFEYGLLLCACQAVRESIMERLEGTPSES